jgi:hypothetical protein
VVLRKNARVKVVALSCIVGTLALLVAVTAQAYLNQQVEATWSGYGSTSLAASNDDLATGSIASASSSDTVANPASPVAELKSALSPALLLDSEPARRALLTAVAPEPNRDCPPAPTTAAAGAGAPTETATMDREARVAQVAAQVTPQDAPQVTAQVTVTRAGTRQTVYTVVRENR